MAWYGTGTIALENGSGAVIGTGTAFVDNVAVGEGLITADGRLYEVTGIGGATSLTISPVYAGSTASGQTYKIAPTQSYIRDLAANAAALVQDFADVRDEAGDGLFPAGTLSAPSLRNIADQDTGVDFLAAAVRLVAGGLEKLRANTSGVGIGIVPTLVFEISNGTISGYMHPGSTYLSVGAKTGHALAFDTNNTQRGMFTATTGNLLLGTTTDASSRLLSVGTGSTLAAQFKNDTAATETIDVWNTATSGDNLFAKFFTEIGGSERGSFDYNRGGGVFRVNNTSDYRAKVVEREYTPEEAVAVIRGVNVYWARMQDASVFRPMFLAHEVQEVRPEAVTGEKDAVDENGNDVMQKLDQTLLLPDAVKALGWALDQIEALAARVAALEA